MALWHNRRGNFSPLRAATLLMLVAPFLALIYFAIAGTLGPRPYTEAIHQMGLWGIRFLMLSLFITPMRGIARYAPLIDIRRMMGVGVFCYMIAHVALYIASEAFDIAKVGAEIVLRYYLTIGFNAWLGLAVLAATSNDTMIRELGGIRWRKLHRVVYPVSVLGMIHYFMQSKLEVYEPTVIAGIFTWLMVYRLLHWLYPRQGEFPLWVIAASWFAVGLLDFLLEAVAFWIAFDVPVIRILVTDFTFQTGIRPGWYVWGVGVLVTLVGAIRMRQAEGRLQLAASSPGRTPS